MNKKIQLKLKLLNFLKEKKILTSFFTNFQKPKIHFWFWAPDPKIQKFKSAPKQAQMGLKIEEFSGFANFRRKIDLAHQN